jgi:choline dehydrogenase-like flavoprotein
VVHAKSDAEIIAVRPALQYPNVTLLIDAQVMRLNTNASGTTVTEVVIQHEGRTEIVRGNIVVSSCGAANSARLLLMSANEKHPNGLANGSDQVGRNYMFHTSQAVLAISKEPNPTQYQKTLGLNDFYFGMEGFNYPVGSIQMVGKSQAPMYRGEKPIETLLAPNFVLEKIADHAVDFWLMTEDLPKPENRITVDKEGQITLNYTATNEVPSGKLYDKLKSMLGHCGMHEHLIPRQVYLKNDIGVAGVAHQSGTCKFGTDPKTSVLDPNCKAHELDNLYVVDTSFFPSIGAVNPALTAMANALRVGDHLLERLK